MELVIKIPDEAYQRLLEEQHLPNRIDLEYFIVHGTPLPKGHGRLVDADELKTSFPTCDNSLDIKIASVRATINHAPTIIEKDGD